jgi:dienelactone hydrolase
MLRKGCCEGGLESASMRHLILAFLLAACALAQAAPTVKHHDVQTKDFRGRVYEPVGVARKLAVVLIGGSEGQLDLAEEVGPQLAAQGYVVLGVDYHDGWRPGRKLDMVPVETFTAAVKWLYASPYKPAKVAVLGDSRGSEGALLTGIYEPTVSAVVVFVPSSVMWGATDNDDKKHHASWSWGGAALGCGNCVGTGDFTEVLDRLPADDPARLPVEKMHGAVFLAGSSEDEVWPSGRMEREIADRLLAKHFGYPVTVLTYPHSSHLMLGTGPSSPTATYAYGGKEFTMNYGGTAAGTEQARDESWAAMLLFLSQVEAAK